MGRPRRLKSISVSLIYPEAYPQYRNDPDHRFIKMSDEDRLEEVIRICAKIHAEAKLKKAYEEEPLRKLKQAS